MPPESDRQPISFLDLLRATWRQRGFFLVWTLGICLVALVIALLLPNTYRSEALLAPMLERSEEAAASKPLSALQGVAALVGFSPRSYTEIQEKVAYLESKALIRRVVEEHPQVMPGLFPKKWNADKSAWKDKDPKKQPDLWDAIRQFEENYKVMMNSQTGLLVVRFESGSPAFCTEILEIIISEANEGLRAETIEQSKNFMRYLEEKSQQTDISEARQVLLSLMASELRRSMLAECTEDFAFKTIDAPMVPDRHAKPRRSLLLIAIGLLAGATGSLLSLWRDQRGNPISG
jgi:uncharacterized protein involved in exopolysaccharide biosynthesis